MTHSNNLNIDKKHSLTFISRILFVVSTVRRAGAVLTRLVARAHYNLYSARTSGDRNIVGCVYGDHMWIVMYITLRYVRFTS